MRRVPPSTVIREEIDHLLSRGADREANLLSELAELGLRYLVQQGLEQEQQDFLGRGHYERRGDGQPQRGYRNGYEDARFKTAEGTVGVKLPQVRDAEGPYRSGLMHSWNATRRSSSVSSSRCTRADSRPETSRTAFATRPVSS